ncbi:MAG: hypothetical protein HC907_30025 [Richelia sp. SM1_7_0]|nr:hypothetical protein [Richelia sp. SM1_7_0]
MTQIFGEFIEKHPTKEKLTLEFLPDSISVEEFWRNNDLSANFIADFLTTFVTKMIRKKAIYSDKRKSRVL